MTAPEVCFLIGRGGAVLWADFGVSAVSLPDSRARWEAIWTHRAELAIVAHSHPLGPRAFSAEDESTMAALDAALGRPLGYVVVAPDGVVTRSVEAESLVGAWWLALLRRASGL